MKNYTYSLPKLTIKGILIALVLLLYTNVSFSQVVPTEDPDNLGGPVYIGKVEPFTLPVSNQKSATSKSKLASNNSKTAATSILEWPNPGAVHIDKTAQATGTDGRWKINLLVQGKNIQTTTDVVLVIDNSGSMGGSTGKMTSAIAAANTFVDQLLTGSSGIQISVVVINKPNGSNNISGTPFAIQNFTSSASDLHTAINSIIADGGTNIQGGFYAARTLLEASSATKKVTILLTDGDPTYSYQSTVNTPSPIPTYNCNNSAWTPTAATVLSNLSITSSDYSTIAGDGSNFNLALYSITSQNCGTRNNPKYTTLTVGNNGIPTIYEAKLLMNGSAKSDVYTIGFQVSSGGNAEKTLTDSQNKGYFPATTANIASIYSQIGSNIAYAATNAVLTDPMSTYVVLESASTPTYSVLPITTGNVVVSKGTVTFTNNGYVLNDPNNPASGNSSKIKWKLNWNIGTVSEGGDNMYYYVNMAPNTYPTVLYDANEQTYMDYIDVNNNPNTHQQTPDHFTIPKVSGGKGSIEIIYYRVNQAGQPVNSIGTVVPLDNALKLIPGNSKYFESNGSTALTVNQAYTVSPDVTYTSNGLNYGLYCGLGNVSITPTPTEPNKKVWFGYIVSPSKVNCWDNFVFNSGTCTWNNTGVQPSTPTVTVVNNCDGTSTLTASAYTGTLLWSTAETTPSITVNTAATYTVTQSINGCSSLAGTGIAAPKTKPTKVSTPVTICSGETYTWAVNGTAYTVGGTYTKTNNGCTADQELVLTVTPKPTKVSTPVTICSGETYTWAVNGTAYTVGGTYTKTNDGCTADQELVLTVTPKPTKVSTPVTICSGETYTWAVNGTAYTVGGTYTKTNDGCTADQELVLTVTPKPTKVSTPVTICSGETYTWAVNGTAYTAGGTYTKTNNGCTADQELVLTVTPKPTKVSTPVTICSGETYTWAVNGTAYTVGGTYTKTNNGCTADQELVLTVTPKPTKVSTPVTICSGETYTWAVNGTAYTVGGTYTKTNNGCTADQELVLTVTPKPTKVSTPVTICSGETYTWAVNGTAYTAGGTYTKTNNGCTADQELVLTVTPKPTKVSTPVTICSGETYTWAVNGTAYTAGGTYTKTNNGCTADQELVLTVTPKPTKVSTPVTICSGETYTWAVNGTAYTAGGTYTKTNNGCTADQELVLTVTPKPTKVSTPVTICSGETYTWAVNGTAYTAGGTYTKTNNGCTADQELVLTVTPKPTKVSTPVTICSGETYTWAVNGTAYTAGGTYTKTNDGCTADQELVLTVTPKPTKVSTPVTICSGETYTWAVNGTAYTVGGTYTKTNDGCTADQELVLTVTPKPTKVSTPVTICSGETYTWAVNGTAYTAGGTYTKTNNGCTADQELVLTVTPKPTKVSTPVTICSGETYTWAVNGTAYTVGGTYTKTNNGCTADQELVLTVTPKPTKVSTPVTICSGETYTWAVNGTAYTAGGTYTKTNDGCTADQELVLTVTPKPTKVSTPVTICSGETYTWAVNGTAYTVGGTYTKTNNGCTADQELVLTVTPKPTKVSTPVTICSGETYTWAVNGTAYTVGGTYTKTNDGCTADQELVLTVTPKPTKVSTPVTICSGETYTWAVNGTAYTAGGTYTKTNNGCTADQELVLTVTPKPTKVSTPVTICSGETYTWAVNGTAYTAGGTYTKTNDGCTADQELVLTVTPKPTKVSTPVTICSGETYTWAVNGTAYTVGGTYTKTNDGCTADQELVLTVTPKPTKVSTPVTICSGETYTWAVNGTAYTAGGTYTKTNNGCTADQELVLTVTPKPTKVSTPVTICSGETYTWAVNGTAYTVGGTYTKTNNGCTADQELVLTVTPKPTKVSTPVTICSGETYTWAVNGTAYTVGGTYTKTNNGCTADQELVLTVTPKPTKVSTPVTICSGETYTWAVNGTAYTAGGTYTKTNDGCTADQELVLTVTPKPTKVSTPVTICSGETYTWAVNGTAYTVGGTYTKTNNGCTADQELVLTVTPKPTKVSTPVTICSGETYTWAVNGTAYTVGGTYTKTNDGCTADQELVLTVTPKPTKVSTPVTICSGETYTWAVNGTAYTVGGTYTKTNNGCTADQELVLTVTPKPTKVSTPVTICSGETYTWAVNGTAYTVGGTYTKTNNGCTADQELVLTVTPKPTKVSTPVTICSGETYTWAVNGTAYTAGGTYTKTNNGCTADQELVLTVTPKPTKVSTPVTICSGETYTWAVNGTAYTAGGTYTKTNNGCTADQELVLTVTPKPTKVSTPVTICSGETYTWAVNGTAYTAGGTYTKTNNGCTADQELVLTVTPKPTKVSTPVTICSGETYTWAVNGTAYTAGGTYTKTNNGCTADQELVLTVTPKPTKVSTPVTICSGETYTWAVNGTAYTAGGTYTKTNNGCTADQELVLTVTPKPTKVSTPVTICSGETYTWAVNGTAYTVGGTYTKTNNGCTADQELVLTVTPKPTKVSTPVTICSGETYTWAVNGTAYTVGGTYTKTNNGCTADQELVLTVTPKPTKVSTPVTICSGETYTWAVNGTAYTAGGTYTKTNDGCTADQELVLTVTPKPNAPTILCYQTATWNPAACQYDITGEKPAAPTALGYQTVTWNPITCQYDVTNPKIDAVNDNAGPIDGINGVKNIVNVLNNDTLNGTAVNLAEVNLSTVTPDPTGYISLNPNGSVDIKDGTPAGNYTLTYSICEKLNPTNCDSAIVTINVICNENTKASGIAYNVGNNNSPLANVPITLTPINIVNGQNTISGPGVIQITNAQGYYNFTGMPTGDYVLQVQDANLNVAYNLYNTTSSFLVVKVEKCKYLLNNFGYDKGESSVLGDFVWYDTNNNGLQDEWYDANNDGIVTKNIPDANGNIDSTKWEWIDLNGDGSYKGLSNYGELNAAGFGNNTTNIPNLFITGPNGYSVNNTMGIQGYWRVRPTDNLFGKFTVELKMDDNLSASAKAFAATGLIKVLPGGPAFKVAANKKTSVTNSQISTICGVSNGNPQIAEITAQDLVHKDLDFGIICKEFGATDDTYNEISCTSSGIIGNVLSNDLLNGTYVATNLVNFSVVSGSNPNITIDNLGNVNLTSGLAAGTYTYTYSLCDKSNAGNCVSATITINVKDTTAPVIAKLPEASTISCPATPTFVQATATDTCNGEVKLTFKDIRTAGACAGSYSITRTWTATDVSGNTATASQTINVQDVTGPTTDTVYDLTVAATCSAIPAIPNLIFKDNCSAVQPALYSETIVNQTNTGYSIVRQWNVSDACGNTSTFAQTVNVTVANAGLTLTSSACNADSTPIDLNSILPAGTPTNGTWTSLNNAVSLQGRVLSAFNMPLGDYAFEYKVTDGTCPMTIKLNMNINFDCKVLGCEAIVVHKALTPNWDGLNDVLVIDGVDDSVCYPSGINVEIYNRWGVLVYETTKYNNTSNYFDGTSKGRTTISKSDGLPTGTYYYILNYESYDGTGNIQVNKQDGFLYLSR